MALLLALAFTDEGRAFVAELVFSTWYVYTDRIEYRLR